MKRISLIVLLLLSIFVLSSCQIKTTSKEEYVKLYYDYHVQSKKSTGAIDLRDLNTDFASGHIKGFVNYNYQKGNKEEFIYYVSSMYNKNTYIFLIDNNGESVVEASNILKEEGYKHIIIYQEGYSMLEDYAKEYLQIVTGTDDCGC